MYVTSSLYRRLYMTDLMLGGVLMVMVVVMVIVVLVVSVEAGWGAVGGC